MAENGGERKRFILALLNVALLVVGLAMVVYLLMQHPSELNNALISLFSLIVGALVQQHRASQGYFFKSAEQGEK